MTNFLTEKQARRELCPHFRFVVNEAEVVHNGNAPIYIHRACMASECGMAWRWANAQHSHEPTVGYCGISGRPER